MTRIAWRLVNLASRMLEPGERDVVCGDIAESGESAAQALSGVLGLVARRQAELWNEWRPWAALVALVAPPGMLLTLASRRIAGGTAIYVWMYLANWDTAYFRIPLFRHDLAYYGGAVLAAYLALICWSWTGGWMLGFLSRRTIGINGTLFCLLLALAEIWGGPRPYHAGNNDAVFSQGFYRVLFPLIVQAVLVLLPALRGMQKGLRGAAFPIRLQAALWASAIVTMISLTTDRTWWPPWLQTEWYSPHFWVTMRWLRHTASPACRTRSSSTGMERWRRPIGRGWWTAAISRRMSS